VLPKSSDIGSLVAVRGTVIRTGLAKMLEVNLLLIALLSILYYEVSMLNLITIVIVVEESIPMYTMQIRLGARSGHRICESISNSNAVLKPNYAAVQQPQISYS
jgi:hypothetical protein